MYKPVPVWKAVSLPKRPTQVNVFGVIKKGQNTTYPRQHIILQANKEDLEVKLTATTGPIANNDETELFNERFVLLPKRVMIETARIIVMAFPEGCRLSSDEAEISKNYYQVFYGEYILRYVNRDVRFF